MRSLSRFFNTGMSFIATFLVLVLLGLPPDVRATNAVNDISGSTLESIDALEEDMQIDDPLEGFNRVMFEVNRTLDGMFLKPAAIIYEMVAPEVVRDRVHDFLNNLHTPLTFVHDVLQLEAERAMNSLARFTINTTLGMGGIYDVAKDLLGVEYHFEDAGQTLAAWGVGSGPYLVLPVLGPTTFRDAVGKVGDFFIDPVQVVARRENLEELIYARLLIDYLDLRVNTLDLTAKIDKTSYDPYITYRTLYVQNREYHIHNELLERDSPVPLEEEDI